VYQNKEPIVFTVTSRIVATGVVRDLEIKHQDIKAFLANEDEYPLWFKIMDARGWISKSIGCAEELLEQFPEFT